MWAMIAIKNKPSSMQDSNINLPIAESMSKSSDFTSWGSPVKVFQISRKSYYFDYESINN